MQPLPRENVQLYPRPPRLEAVPQRLLVRHGGDVVADTTEGMRILETHHAPTYYFPRNSVAAELAPLRGGSLCEWKGAATFFDVVIAGCRLSRCAWSYPEPTDSFDQIAGHVAFYATAFDEAWVGDVRVTPQPGDFYGGWVTPNLDGIVKGRPGTEGW